VKAFRIYDELNKHIFNFARFKIDSDLQTQIILYVDTDFNSLEVILASDVNAQMNKSVITDVGSSPYGTLVIQFVCNPVEIARTITQQNEFSLILK